MEMTEVTLLHLVILRHFAYRENVPSLLGLGNLLSSYSQSFLPRYLTTYLTMKQAKDDKG